MRAVNERSGREFGAYFENTTSEPQAPGTAHWRLVQVYLGSVTILQDWTEETPVAVTDPATGGVTGIKITIHVDGMHHRFTSSSRARREERELQVVADMGTPREYSQTMTYYVEAMAGGRS